MLAIYIINPIKNYLTFLGYTELQGEDLRAVPET